MTNPLIKNGQVQKENVEHLIWLLSQARKLNIAYIVLPFVDNSSLKAPADQETLIDLLKKILTLTSSLAIEIHLETDLSPLEFRKVFEDVNHPLLKMNYDIGNSASLGFDVDQEMLLLGNYLGSVHVKDRVLGGATVSLGTGNADLKKCFQWFDQLAFNRWYVLQVARGLEGQESAHIESLIATTKDLINGTWIKP